MDNVFFDTYYKILNLNVSRETCVELETLISMIQEKNKEINIISKKMTEKNLIRQRHVIDSAQIIDFIDLNYNTTCDLGTGGGMPGLIVATVMKKLKNKMKIMLYEKSHHKCVFLRDVSKKLKLNTEIIQKDIFKITNIETGTIMTRAFKPMPIILDLVNNNFKKYENLIMFMGSSGKKVLKETLNEWDLDFEQKKHWMHQCFFFSRYSKEMFLVPIFDDFLYIKHKDVVQRIIDNKTAKESPIKSNILPKTGIKTNILPILTIAEYPTIVDSFDCNFAFKIELIVSGIIAIINICKLGIPDEYF